MSRNERAGTALVRQQMLQAEVDKELTSLGQSLAESLALQKALDGELQKIQVATSQAKASFMSAMDADNDAIALLEPQVLNASQSRRLVHSRLLEVEAEFREAETELQREREGIAAEHAAYWPSSSLEAVSEAVAAAVLASGEAHGCVGRVTALVLEVEALATTRPPEFRFALQRSRRLLVEASCHESLEKEPQQEKTAVDTVSTAIAVAAIQEAATMGKQEGKEEAQLSSTRAEPWQGTTATVTEEEEGPAAEKRDTPEASSAAALAAGALAAELEGPERSIKSEEPPVSTTTPASIPPEEPLEEPLVSLLQRTLLAEHAAAVAQDQANRVQIAQLDLQEASTRRQLDHTSRLVAMVAAHTARCDAHRAACAAIEGGSVEKELLAVIQAHPLQPPTQTLTVALSPLLAPSFLSQSVEADRSAAIRDQDLATERLAVTKASIVEKEASKAGLSMRIERMRQSTGRKAANAEKRDKARHEAITRRVRAADGRLTRLTESNEAAREALSAVQGCVTGVDTLVRLEGETEDDALIRGAVAELKACLGKGRQGP